MLITNILTKGEITTLFINRNKGFKEVKVLTSDIEKIRKYPIRIISKILEKMDIDRLERKCKFVIEKL